MIAGRICALDPEDLPPEGFSVNSRTGALSYNVGGTGAVIHLTTDAAIQIARALLEFAKQADRPPAEIVNLAEWRTPAAD